MDVLRIRGYRLNHLVPETNLARPTHIKPTFTPLGRMHSHKCSLKVIFECGHSLRFFSACFSESGRQS
jgi:hypothetical protein